jgi:hypothetical protein
VTLSVWTLLTPPSWFFFGPVYLALMVWDRFEEYWVFQRVQIATQPGIYAPSRYGWPFELAVLLGSHWRCAGGLASTEPPAVLRPISWPGCVGQ